MKSNKDRQRDTILIEAMTLVFAIGIIYLLVKTVF